ncbi:hypothetical protein TcWFU_010198 [Taenia crassiceps]|uniref:Secreted protein n=1 Tax=Taenia crassiceps TaxID=6207 RepID=A0ABR4QBX2_9CEST
MRGVRESIVPLYRFGCLASLSTLPLMADFSSPISSPSDHRAIPRASSSGEMKAGLAGSSALADVRHANRCAEETHRLTVARIAFISTGSPDDVASLDRLIAPVLTPCIALTNTP